MLFEQISNSSYFTKSAMILFLNKFDLFVEKLSSGMSPIQKYFQDFHPKPSDTKPEQEIQTAKLFFRDKFRGLVRH